MKKIFLLLTGMLAGLVFVEILLRFVYSPIKFYGNSIIPVVGDEVIGYRLKPDWRGWFFNHDAKCWITVNSNGLRDTAEVEYKKVPAQKRIVFMGDSFTMGIGVNFEDTYPEVVERTLTMKTGKEFRCLNFGVFGYNTTQEYKYYIKEVIKYEPDLVIVGFLPVDDILFNTLPLVHDINRSKKDKKDIPKIDSSIKKILRQMRTYIFISNLIKSHAPGVAVFLIEKGLMDGAYYNGIIKGLEVYCEPQSEYINEKWAITEQIIKQWSKSARRNNHKLLIVAIPVNIQVLERCKVLQEKYTRIYYEKNKMPLPRINLRLPNERLSNICRRNGVYFLDLLEHFENYHGDKEKLYFRYDGHWTKEGHKLAADKITEFLLNNNLI